MSHMKQLNHLKIPLQAIKDSTHDFSNVNMIGRGGYGRVYKGILSWADHENQPVAVKRLDDSSKQGNKEFYTEITMLSQYHHENIVTLIGFCDDHKEMILVYEYASRGSLDTYLSDTNKLDLLCWHKRLKIAVGIASALSYLHNHVAVGHRVVHRDIKSANILLDENWNPKLSDFGLSRIGLANQPNSFVPTFACGTFGYCDPEYVKTGLLTKESDVFSFGVVLFEVLCGRLEQVNAYNDERRFLHQLARNYYKCGKIYEIADHRIRDATTMSDFSEIAYQCIQDSREDRPTITHVVSQLMELKELAQFEGTMTIFDIVMWLKDEGCSFLYDKLGDCFGFLYDKLCDWCSFLYDILCAWCSFLYDILSDLCSFLYHILRWGTVIYVICYWVFFCCFFRKPPTEYQGQFNLQSTGNNNDVNVPTITVELKDKLGEWWLHLLCFFLFNLLMVFGIYGSWVGFGWIIKFSISYYKTLSIIMFIIIYSFKTL